MQGVRAGARERGAGEGVGGQSRCEGKGCKEGGCRGSEQVRGKGVQGVRAGTRQRGARRGDAGGQSRCEGKECRGV